MKPIGIVKVWALAMACVFSLIFCTQVFSADQKVTWRMGVLYPRASSFSQVYDDLAQDIKTMSGGRLNIQMVYDGEGVPVPEMLSAIRSGLLELGQPWPPIHSGELPVGDVSAGLPGAPAAFDVVLAMYREPGLTKVLKEAYADLGITWLAEVPQPSCYAYTKEKVESLEDFKGMKVRATGAYGKMVRQFGALPVTVAFGEIYTSLATGVIEGGVGNQIVEIYDSKWYEAAKYLFPLPVAGYQAAPILVNSKAWNKLPDDLKAIVRAAVDSNIIKMRKHCVLTEKSALQKMQKEGFQIGPMLSEEDQKRWYEAGRKVWDEYAEAGPYSQAAVEEIRAFMEKYGVE